MRKPRGRASSSIRYSAIGSSRGKSGAITTPRCSTGSPSWMLFSIICTPFVSKESAVGSSALTSCVEGNRQAGARLLLLEYRLCVNSPAFIRLRYPATCSVCGAELPARAEARWDREARTATCRACIERTESSAEEPAVSEAAEAPPQAKTLQRGVAGASAARRYKRLHERREQDARDRFGRLSGVYLALTEDPQSTTAWATGSRGERALGDYLEKLHDGVSVIALHDRRIPR